MVLTFHSQKITENLRKVFFYEKTSLILLFYKFFIDEKISENNLNEILSDSPDLSELSEGKFGNGGRTSTPNLAKRKRSSSVTSREVKYIRRQIEGYFQVMFFIIVSYYDFISLQ